VSSSSDYIRHSQLVDQLVLEQHTLEEFGQIEVLWEYPKVHRVLGFICKVGRSQKLPALRGSRRKLAFNLDQVEQVGSNGVLVTSAPVDTDADRVRQLESLLGAEVWADDGNKVGKISDYVFHLHTGTIRQYLITSSGWRGLTGSVYALYPSQILSVGRQRVLISAAIANSLELYQPGIQDKVAQVGEVLRSEKTQVTQGLHRLVEQAKSKAHGLAGQAKERLQTLSDDLLEIRDSPFSDFQPPDDGGSDEVEFDFDAPWEALPLQSPPQSMHPRQPLGSNRPKPEMDQPNSCGDRPAAAPPRPIFAPQPKRSDSSQSPSQSSRSAGQDPWADDEPWV
jgi:sporulation protein YlmC with PRC-barrel domain